MTFRLDRVFASPWIAAGGCLLSISCTGTLGGDDSSEQESGADPGSGCRHRCRQDASAPRDSVGVQLHRRPPPGNEPAARGRIPGLRREGLRRKRQRALEPLAGPGPGYYDAARTLAEDAFSHEEQRAKILVCDPAEGTDDRCAREIIQRFGLRAFRRPLEAAEVDRYAAQYDDARTTLEMSPVEAVQHVVRTVLTSPHFILRIELGPDSARSPGALNGYEVASRLSYLLWSSLPDDELFDAAESDELATAGELEQQVDRMLDDPKSAAFFQNFFGQWLGTRTLPSHNADTSQFPSWNDEMKGAMLDQVNEYFADFTTGGRPWSEFLTAPHPESRLIEPLYANDPEGLREGFLTLPAFLTLSSRADRTSPTSRAKTILEQLFCAPMVPPANVDIPELGAARRGRGRRHQRAQGAREAPRVARLRGLPRRARPDRAEPGELRPDRRLPDPVPERRPDRRDGGVRGRGVRGHLRPRAGARGGRPLEDVPLRAASSAMPCAGARAPGTGRGSRRSPGVGPAARSRIWRSRW